MKKIICITLVLLILLSCLTACDFAKDLVSSMADNVEATPKVEKMITALADDDMDDAKALLHPQVAETSDTAITQMRDYLAGRTAKTIEITTFNISTSTGTGGKTRQEQATYQVTLSDNTVIFLNMVYLSNNQGSGFVSFQVVLGSS